MERIEIKIGGRNIDIDVLHIDKENNIIEIFCNDKSFNIFKTWFDISKAHIKSNEFSKKNICVDIETQDSKYKDCCIIYCCNNIYNKVMIEYDYEITSVYDYPIGKEDTVYAMYDLFFK